MYVSEGKRYMLRELGDQWRLQVIDLELCVYRDLGDYDIEVSGVGGMKRSKIGIYVWKKTDGLQIVEQVHRLSIDQAIEACRALEVKYSGR